MCSVLTLSRTETLRNRRSEKVTQTFTQTYRQTYRVTDRRTDEQMRILLADKSEPMVVGYHRPGLQSILLYSPPKTSTQTHPHQGPPYTQSHPYPNQPLVVYGRRSCTLQPHWTTL